ncbi:MAG: Unknown protein [uncultured Sulfurovum sp.]|uniref:Leucine-rich repeat domain-containing protein n=1 Tax=uncultured Sulfurovum sp. TaxID=269237 RepID=A0A6S6RYD5_9BACT|nr:MAG: Unknown protein [uncultured Sulfurovum sp.]
MVIKNLQIFIRWAKQHEIEFEYLPSSATEFNQLEAMKIADAPNPKSFRLPLLVADFSNLEYLELSWLGLEQLPKWVESCKSLEALSIMGNEIETLPSWIENLSKLEKLDCSSNDLYFLPSSSSSLLELDASYNELEGFGSWEGNFPNLIKLNCSRTRMEEIPSSLLNLQSLKEFICEDSPNLSEFSKELKHKIDLQLQERKKVKDIKQKAYLDAFKRNTLNTYRRYLKEYPEGQYAEEARARIKVKRFKLKINNEVHLELIHPSDAEDTFTIVQKKSFLGLD